MILIEYLHVSYEHFLVYQSFDFLSRRTKEVLWFIMIVISLRYIVNWNFLLLSLVKYIVEINIHVLLYFINSSLSACLTTYLTLFDVPEGGEKDVFSVCDYLCVKVFVMSCIVFSLYYALCFHSVCHGITSCNTCYWIPCLFYTQFLLLLLKSMLILRGIYIL